MACLFQIAVRLAGADLQDLRSLALKPYSPQTGQKQGSRVEQRFARTRAVGTEPAVTAKPERQLAVYSLF